MSKVCLDKFLLKEGRVLRALAKMASGRSPGEDLRGANGCVAKKISEEDKKYVMDHINSFPAYESHYTRKHNEHRKYLCESLNIRKMYCLYKEKCEAGGKTILKDTYYRYIFNTKFNLHFCLDSLIY